MKSEAQLAKQFRCSVRTARRWRAEGAPLESVSKMREWLTGRQHLPKATQKWLEGAKHSDFKRALFKIDVSLPKGAPAALARLEATEAALYTQLQAAIESADPVRIKLTRESWLKVGDSLRRYDVAIEALRRDSGAMVARQDVERNLAMLCAWLRSAWETQNGLIIRELPDEQRTHVAQQLKRFCWRSILEACAMLAAQSGIPDWMPKALIADVEQWLEFTAEDFTRLTEVFKIASEVRAEKLST